MLNTLLDSDLVKLIKQSLFVKIAVGAGLLLTLTLAVQAYAVFTSDDSTTTATEAGETIRVNIGEMYFVQEGSELPDNVLEAEVGDVIEFHNEGSLRHSVTIDALDFDEVLSPGESTTLQLDTAVDEVVVNCKFHAGHDAVLTVKEGSGSTRAHAQAMPDIDIDTSQLPTRSHEDAIERLDYEMVDGVKEFHLTAEHILWEYSDGETHQAWAFQGQMPGPEIRVNEGDDVRVVFENKLPVATTVHWHGVDVPNEADGVPHVTQDPVEPGETFVYEFSAIPAGTKFYHSHGSHHGDEGLQVDMGLSGPFIIEPAGYQPPDREYNMVLTERPDVGLYPINGRTYPNQEIFRVSEGDRVRVRIIHAGSSEIHPIHLHGHQFEVVAMDGNPVPGGTEQLRNNQPLMPGETYDIEFTADNPGRWMFHCHQLNHVAGGMIAELQYE